MVLGAVCNGKKWEFGDGFRKLRVNNFIDLSYMHLLPNLLIFVSINSFLNQIFKLICIPLIQMYSKNRLNRLNVG